MPFLLLLACLQVVGLYVISALEVTVTSASTRRPFVTGILSRCVSLTGRQPRFRVFTHAASGRSPRGRAQDALRLLSTASDATDGHVPFQDPSKLRSSSGRSGTDPAPHDRLCQPSESVMDRRNLRRRQRG